ncbi:glycosyltransferase family 9 protein [Crocinitomicaceae bacterium]|nr:glycosyltransferase family 9 protein [Crocinitomicaceae bacterium]
MKAQLKDVEIHYLTKVSFKSIVAPNPNVSKVFSIEKSIDEVLTELKAEQYDWIIDLHNNIRTKGLKSKLRRPSKTFRKLNWEKWLLVNAKINKLPEIHVVDRYFETVAHLGVQPDGKPGDFIIQSENEVNLSDWNLEAKRFVAIAIGAQHATKCLPVEKLVELIQGIEDTVVLVGGPTDQWKAKSIISGLDKEIVSTVGRLNLQQSASLVKQSKHLITHDTGMMHIASCFDVPMSTVWGNTVPDFGMYPYQPKQKTYSIHQVDGLKCRPCSKIGSETCPKKHFDCMLKQDISSLLESINN